MTKKITKIDAIKTVLQILKRVAAYARVSDGKEAMLHSLSTQVTAITVIISKSVKTGSMLAFTLIRL